MHEKTTYNLAARDPELVSIFTNDQVSIIRMIFPVLFLEQRYRNH